MHRGVMVAVAVAVGISGMCATNSYAMKIEFTALTDEFNSTSPSYNAQAYSALMSATDDLANRFSNNITIRLAVGFANNLGDNTTVSRSNFYTTTETYSSVRSQLIANASGNPASGISATVNALPTSMPTFTTPTTYQGTNYTFGIANSINLTTANVKALTGQSGNAGLPYDASITLNSQVPFSYGGPQAGKFDFATAYEHELVHVMGFTSATDSVDFNLSNKTTSASIRPTVLDLYRFSAANVPTTLNQFTNNARDLTPGSNDYLSDGTAKLQMSTGAYTGDGHSAYNWKADEISGLNLGVMDPTLSAGQVTPLSDRDLLGLQLLGYTLVAAPEPGSLALAATASVALLARRRRR